MTRILWQTVLLAVLVLFSALFSAAETALTSVGRLRLRVLADEGNRRARVVERLIERPARTLSALLIGNNVVNVAASTIGAAVSIELFGPRLGLVVATVAIALGLLIFGEITPKTLAAQYPERVSLRLGPPMALLIKALNPVAKIFGLLSALILRMFGIDPARRDPFITEEELRTMVNVGEEQGILEEEERAMIHSVFEFGETGVREVMRPRIEISGVPRQSSIEKVMQEVVRDGFSRVPVYDGTIDNIVGILYAKDLLKACVEGNTKCQIQDLLRPAYYVPETKKVGDLFRELQREKVHMAVILDEFGGTSGIVTIEDLVEEIFGEIEDEFDHEDALFTPLDENTTIIDARLSISEANEQLGLHLPENGYDTVGGLVFSQLGRLPGEGEQVRVDGITLTVERMTGRRVSSVRIFREP